MCHICTVLPNFFLSLFSYRNCSTKGDTEKAKMFKLYFLFIYKILHSSLTMKLPAYIIWINDFTQWIFLEILRDTYPWKFVVLYIKSYRDLNLLLAAKILRTQLKNPLIWKIFGMLHQLIPQFLLFFYPRISVPWP